MRVKFQHKEVSSYHGEKSKLSDHHLRQLGKVCLVVHQGSVVSVSKSVKERQVGSVGSIFQVLKSEIDSWAQDPRIQETKMEKRGET